MFGRNNKSVLDQAQEMAEELAARIQPALENAIDQLGPALADAKEKAGPALADARDKVVDNAAPVVKDAKERFTHDVVPLMAAAVASASEKTEPVREEAKRRGLATAAALKGEVEAPQKGGKLKKVLVAGGVLGLIAFAVKKLQGDQSSGWQQSYTPAPPPKPATVPTPGTDPLTDSSFGNQAKGASTTGATAGSAIHEASPLDDQADRDAAASSPDEAAADLTDEPHDITTPDSPADVVDVDAKKDPQA